MNSEILDEYVCVYACMYVCIYVSHTFEAEIKRILDKVEEGSQAVSSSHAENVSLGFTMPTSY